MEEVNTFILFVTLSSSVVDLLLETDLDTCCVESNGQEDQDFVDVDVETDIVDVLRFDNANFSSLKSQLKSPIPQQRLNHDHHSSDDHKSFNTCQHEM